jgi:hypothetical protein
MVGYVLDDQQQPTGSTWWQKYWISIIWIYAKKQELLTLPEHMFSPQFLVGFVVLDL